MLTGCIFNDKTEIGLDLPSTYRATAGARDGAPPSLDWWRGFRSPELTALIEAAQTDNFDIAAAIALIQLADAQSKVAGAPLIPALDFEASDTTSRASQATGSGGGGGASQHTTYSVALNASYEIDFWGKNRAASRAAEENAVAVRYNKEVVVLATIVSVATDYFQVLTSQDRLRVAHQNLDSSVHILDLIKQRSAAGTASDLDVAQQESLVATQRAAIPLLDQTLRQNTVALAVLLGRAPVSVRVRGGSLDRLGTPRVTPGLPSELLQQRPDIRAAEANLASADASVESARAAMFPSITLTGQGGYQSNALQLLFTPPAAFYQMATNLTQPILDGFRLEGLLEEAKSTQLQLLQTYRKTVVQSFADVENALIALKDTTDRQRLQQVVVTTSQRAFNVAEQRLREGTIDMVTVLQTQQTLFSAQDTLVQAKLARFQAVLSLFQALGGGWLRPPPPVAEAIKTQ